MVRLTDHREIAGRFNARFGRAAGVLLIGGAPEPLYLPVDGGRAAMIRYTRDHAQSALHEIAHWLLAGPRRRRLVDYGLWYQPPPRTAADQARFYRAEVSVQALEMLLAEGIGLPFHFSADNLHGDDGAGRQWFESRVRQRVAALREAAREGALDATADAVLVALNPDWRSTVIAADAGPAMAGG